MSLPRDTMELREEDIRSHYGAAAEMLMGIDHTPRLAEKRLSLEAPEKSPADADMAPRFASTPPCLPPRPTPRPDGVRLIDRLAETDGDDPLTSPLQAAVTHALRRALAIALARGDTLAHGTALAELKRANLENRLPRERSAEFTELLAAEALAVLHSFGNAAAFLLALQASEATVEVGAVDEVLTDNAPLALHGALWELDQKIGLHGKDEKLMVATVLAYAEQLMAKVALRAEDAPRLTPFTGASYRVEADEFTIAGFTPARRGRAGRPREAAGRPGQSKFAATIVEALGHEPERPAAYRGIESLPRRVQEKPADVARIKAYIEAHGGPPA